MKKFLKRGLSLALALVMVAGLLPVTAFAAVDSTGRPDGLNYDLILSIYKGTDFPGEPAVYGTSSYQNINPSFQARSGDFANTAVGQLNWEAIDKDLLQGKTSGSTKVWGVFDASGAKQYFAPNSTILAHEADIIRAMKSDVRNESNDEAVLAKYEVVWYVIKFQHRTGWFGASEWHIDGVIKERETFSINYYGNGNTEGSAPAGVIDHPSNEEYIVEGPGDMIRKVNGVSVNFLGWSARADGSGAELDFYQEGDPISADELRDQYGGKLSLYAIWDTTTQHTATVNTYLDGVLTDANDIHETSEDLYLGTDGHYHKLTRNSEGKYTAQIAGNGKFHLFRESGGTYTQIGTHQLTIYNQNASMDIHHYSVTYDPNGGAFETAPGAQNFMYGEAVTAIEPIPTREGYRFLGWKDNNGNPIGPGKTVTSSITAPITLTAQWEETITVTVNVTIDHTDENNSEGYDRVQTKGDVSLTLVSRENGSPYLEVEGKTLKLGNSNAPEEHKATKYTYTFEDMPGGNVEYSVVTSKSGYDTTVTPTQDADGNWTIDVVMEYRPTNFDLNFTVEVDEAFKAKEYYPDAAIVKVTYWSNVEGKWLIITQQDEDLPGVRVDLENGKGTGKYPVWMYESNSTTPYGYRVVVTSFVYPDGTIVPVNDETQIVEWTDDVYTATISDVSGGRKYGEHDGAYYSDNTQEQAGTLKLVINRNKYDVTFDAQGGTINGSASQKVEEQYVIPAFKNYVPTREGGYTFGGWYEDAACTIAATEGVDLTKDITLYAKWIAQLTIQGDVKILGTYQQNGETVKVHDIDRATEAVVVLQENRDGKFYEVDSQKVTFKYGEDQNGTGTYRFSGIPDDGKEYRIQLLLLNYGTKYDNESDNENDCTAVFDGDNVANVDVQLTFVPPSYDQRLLVDATKISANFRPSNVLSEVMYRDVGDIHPFKRISQHDVEPNGVVIALNNGEGEGEQSVWKWHTDGTLYDYQMNITKLYGNVEGVFSSEGTAFNSDTAPFYIEYSEPAHWNGDTEKPSGDLKATLIPNEYRILFDLNAGTDPVTGMEIYQTTEVNDEGDNQVIYVYDKHHKWSYETEFTLAPQREGYKFLGWTTKVNKVESDANGNVTIPADVQEEVVLKAVWEGKRHVKVSAVTGGTASGTGYYISGETATVTATANDKYIFTGWYENGELVSTDASYSFTVTSDRTLKAEFAEYRTITTTVEGYGTVSGGGQYAAQTEVTITATPDEGYNFIGWYKDGNWVTSNLTHTFTVWKDETFIAKFNKEVSYDCDYVYLFGYTDSEIGAEGPLLRGELAQMIYRLVKQKNGAAHTLVTFKDTTGEWFQWGMSYMASKGAINAPNGYAQPYASVTRGETYKMICLGLGFTDDSNLRPSEYAAILNNADVSTPEGSVNYKIYRHEFCSLFNAILGRSGYELKDAEGNDITAATYGYTDLDPSKSYYKTMLIAASTFNDEGKVTARKDRNELDG